MNNYKTNKWLSIAVLLLLLANIVTLVMIWKQKDAKHPNANELPPSSLFEYICTTLNLDSTQVKAYTILRDEHREGQRQLHDKIKATKDEFYNLIQNSHVADSSIKLANDKLSKAVGELELYNFKHFQQIRALCNATQQQKFDTILKDVLNRMDRRPPPFRRDFKENGFSPPPEHNMPPDNITK
ncbi:MAG: hypothetical protein KA319_09405 [Ferruginibacter sp.]|nr:hypothetical protein [Ferruginibacter sp.]